MAPMVYLLMSFKQFSTVKNPAAEITAVLPWRSRTRSSRRHDSYPMESHLIKGDMASTEVILLAR